jgi:CRISPR-associated endonuclease/helicase Cas3
LNSPDYFRYWGKTDRLQTAQTPYHLLCFHSLDVAACGRALIHSGRFSLEPFARELGWELAAFEECFLVMLALHDAGKFARAFQGLAPNLATALVPPDRKKIYRHRHDTLGWLLLTELLGTKQLDLDGRSEWWRMIFRVVTGHHGIPPCEQDGGQPLSPHDYFLKADLDAGLGFAKDLVPVLMTHPWPVPEKRHVEILKGLSYRMAGLCVLADWLGSNQEVFPFRTEPVQLRTYWEEVLPKAAAAVSAAGLDEQAVRAWSIPSVLLPKIEVLTPLQEYAVAVDLPDRPQMFLLEDVTGSGKTEAALLLCHRLLAAGRASGVYFALPTMATANQMYSRVGDIYRRLFADDAQPSLVLAHGARDLVHSFRESILPFEHAFPVDNYEKGEETATIQCAAWLADSRKKSMLADVGVGTIDQALQAILPERHQSLRLLGLANKVLIVDEVHAYDTYTGTLLLKLLEAHAQAGGSAVMLSATMPGALRAAMVRAFQSTEPGAPAEELRPDARYPLATHAVHGELPRTHACATRAEITRTVGVTFIHQEADALERVLELAGTGRCVCWVRNTVHDARHACEALCERLDASRVTLFHSRFAMGDRLEREGAVVRRFGPQSTAADRCGQALVATQVVEQSLDLDFDEMVTDLAPIDLLIQRAGRLRRHLRRNDGGRTVSGRDGRGPATLYVLAPVFAEDPGKDWYSALFPKAAYVYEDAGGLWRTMDALVKSRAIVSPGAPGDAGGVRCLVEAVYGETARSLPAGLQIAERKVDGKLLGNRSQASFNTLKITLGYCEEAGDWEHKHPTPTRLGEDSDTIYLAREGDDGSLEAFLPAGMFPWEMSAVRVRKQGWKLSDAWQGRFSGALQKLRGEVRLLADEHAFVLPLERNGQDWRAEVDVGAGPVAARYSKDSGLEW